MIRSRIAALVLTLPALVGVTAGCAGRSAEHVVTSTASHGIPSATASAASSAARSAESAVSSARKSITAECELLAPGQFKQAADTFVSKTGSTSAEDVGVGVQLCLDKLQPGSSAAVVQAPKKMADNLVTYLGGATAPDGSNPFGLIVTRRGDKQRVKVVFIAPDEKGRAPVFTQPFPEPYAVGNDDTGKSMKLTPYDIYKGDIRMQTDKAITASWPTPTGQVIVYKFPDSGTGNVTQVLAATG